MSPATATITATVTVAAIQMAMVDDRLANVEVADRLVREAAGAGARIVVLPELFDGQYFCKDVTAAHFARAMPIAGHPTVDHFRRLAAELGVVMPVSVYERANATTFNTVAVVDADGSLLGTYRKSHIPDGPGYSEKFYFAPGDTGFRVWHTRHGVIGVAICWDQWFPEAARCMALLGADLLLYPSAIGSEPSDPGYDSSGHWQRVMQGHAAANVVAVVAANRVGREVGATIEVTFYGSSFVTDPTGAVVAQADRVGEAIVAAELDLAAARALRDSWGVFRDRRPDLYGAVVTLDGSSVAPR